MREPQYLCQMPGVIDPCHECVYVTNCPYESPITQVPRDKYDSCKVPLWAADWHDE